MSKLPKGMSQLDYLWTTFGGLKVSEEITGSADSLVTEKSLLDYLTEFSNNAINELETREVDDKIELVAKGANGSEVSVVKFDKEDYLVHTQIRPSTQADLDNDVSAEAGEPLLVFTMLSGKQMFVNLAQFAYIGINTNSINTTVVNGTIESHLKLDKSVSNPVVDFQVTKQGLRIDLTINEEDKQLKLVRGENGLDVVRTINGDELNIEVTTLDEYKLITFVPGTMYFISDGQCMYLNGIRYGGTSTLDYVDSDTIQTEQSEAGMALNVKVASDDFNLTSVTENGLYTALYWEELE